MNNKIEIRRTEGKKDTLCARISEFKKMEVKRKDKKQFCQWLKKNFHVVPNKLLLSLEKKETILTDTSINQEMRHQSILYKSPNMDHLRVRLFSPCVPQLS